MQSNEPKLNAFPDTASLNFQSDLNERYSVVCLWYGKFNKINYTFSALNGFEYRILLFNDRLHSCRTLSCVRKVLKSHLATLCLVRFSYTRPDVLTALFSQVSVEFLWDTASLNTLWTNISIHIIYIIIHNGYLCFYSSGKISSKLTAQS
jgi:hypothetical protein